MPSPKTPYANAPAPSTNRGIMNQNQRKQLDYLDTQEIQAPAPRPAPVPRAAPRAPRAEPNWKALEAEAAAQRGRKR